MFITKKTRHLKLSRPRQRLLSLVYHSRTKERAFCVIKAIFQDEQGAYVIIDNYYGNTSLHVAASSSNSSGPFSASVLGTTEDRFEDRPDGSSRLR